jgi:hypothetical protein
VTDLAAAVATAVVGEPGTYGECSTTIFGLAAAHGPVPHAGDVETGWRPGNGWLCPGRPRPGRYGGFMGRLVQAAACLGTYAEVIEPGEVQVGQTVQVIDRAFDCWLRAK